MIIRYLHVVLRVVRKYRGYTFINILGLTIGITSSLLIGLFIADELSYDKYHPDRNRLFRIVTTVSDKNSKINTALSPSILAKSLKASDLVEEVTRFGAWKTFLLLTTPQVTPKTTCSWQTPTSFSSSASS